MKDPKEVYGDILYREHPVSKQHPPMPRAARAAQFAPFAALTGYDDLIEESARETLSRKTPDAQKREELNRRLRFLLGQTPVPEACFTWFVPDRKKEGGRYESKTGRISQYRPEEESILLDDGEVILLQDLFDIESPAFD